MASLNLDLDYFDHPKTRGLIGLLGRSSEVLPLKLWAYCGRYFAESGRLTGHGVQEIESIVGWWGKPGVAVKAMVKVKFLDHDADGYFVHGWAKRQGHIHALKLRASHAAQVRWSSLKHAPGMPGAWNGQSPISASNQSNKKQSSAEALGETLKSEKKK